MGGGQGVGRPLALGARQGRPGGVGCCVGYSRAATTRSAGRILCEASLNVVPKHPSRRRRDWQRLVPGRWMGVGCLGVGCFWALGARQGHPRGVRSTTRPLCETLDSGHEGPYREDCNGTTAVSMLGIPAELFASVGCFGRWVLGVGCLALGVRQGRPGVQRLRGRWVALSPPVSRRPGRQTSSPPPRTSPPPPTSPQPRTSPPPPPKGRESGPRAAARPPNTPPGPNDPHMRRYREAEENFWALGV